MDNEIFAYEEINLYDCVFSLLDESSSQSKTEESLTKIIKILERGSRDNDFEKTHLLILHQSLDFILNGSSSLKEVASAARVIGLLALTAGPGDDRFSQLLQKYCLPVIHNRLQYCPIFNDLKFNDTLSLLFCVGVINFIIGGGAAGNISMAVMDNVAGAEKVSSLLAIGFVLASMDDSISAIGETIFNLFDSLDCDDTNIITTSAKIIALIFQKHGLSNWDKNLLNFVINKLKYISANNRKIVPSQRKILKGVVRYLETGSIPRKIRRMMLVQEKLYLQTNSWADLIKLEFFNMFLGEEAFQEHMENNVFLRGLFKVSPEKKKKKQSLKLIKED